MYDSITIRDRASGSKDILRNGNTYKGFTVTAILEIDPDTYCVVVKGPAGLFYLFNTKESVNDHSDLVPPPLRHLTLKGNAVEFHDPLT